MTTIEQAAGILTSKYDMGSTKDAISKGVEYGKEIGENIDNLFNFGSNVLKSKTDKNVDPFAEQREEFMEIINDEELSFGDKIGKINNKFEESAGIKTLLFKGIELGVKIVDWVKGLFSKSEE